MSVILLFAGVTSGLFGTFVFSPASIAIATVLISTTWILRIVDAMLIEKWVEATTMFLLVTSYVSVCIWATGLYIDIPPYQHRSELTLIIIGAGFVQLAWRLLIPQE